MYVFQGIDLNVSYVRPSTWDWLTKCAEADCYEAPLIVTTYDNSAMMLVWTYSGDPDDTDIPGDLRQILSIAQDKEWRLIIIDVDGEDCEVLPSYEEEWM